MFKLKDKELVLENLTFIGEFITNEQKVTLLVAEDIQDIQGGQCIVTDDLESNEGYIGNAIILTRRVFNMIESNNLIQEFIDDFYTASMIQMGEMKVN